MKKVKVIISLIVITLVSALCLGLLYVVYNDDSEGFDFFKGTTNVKETGEGYNIIDEQEGFNSYSINRDDMTKLELNINGASVRFENEALWINENLMVQGSELNRNFAVYDDCVLVFAFNYKYKVYGGIVVYNLYQNTFEVVDSIEDMYIDITSVEKDVFFDKAGISLDLKLVDGRYLLKGDKKKDLCKLDKKPGKYAKKSVFYMYDTNDKKFDDTEELMILEFSDYINSNQLCKG